MVSISCVSLISAAGHSPATTAAALRAGIPVFEELAYRDSGGEPVIGSAVAAVPDHLRGASRLRALLELLIGALPNEVHDMVSRIDMPVLFCLKEGMRPGPRAHGVLEDLRLPNGEFMFYGKRIYVESGPTSVIEAIDQSRSLLADSTHFGCLLVAVDSLVDARVLSWLESSQRLKSSNQTDGVIPGEAACLAIVSRLPVLSSSVTVRGIGLAQETATVLNDEPLLGKGLANALRLALQEAGIGMHDVDIRLADLAGESYAFEEFVLALTRVMRQVRDSHSQPIWHAADCIGDCGAAAGLIQFAWLEQAFARGYAPGTIAALHSSSAYGARAVAIVGPSKNGVSS